MWRGGVKDVTSAGTDRFMTGFMSRVGEKWGRARGHAKLEVGSAFKVFTWGWEWPWETGEAHGAGQNQGNRQGTS